MRSRLDTLQAAAYSRSPVTRRSLSICLIFLWLSLACSGGAAPGATPVTPGTASQSSASPGQQPAAASPGTASVALAAGRAFALAGTCGEHRLGAPGGTLGTWQVEVAERNGFFQAQRVAVERGQQPAGRLVEALAGGSRDIVVVPADVVIRAAADGQAVVMVGGAVNRAAFTLVAARDVVDVAGLQGKLVGVRDTDDGTAALARAILSAKGLGDADYRLVPFEDVAVRAAAVANGTVGASLLDAARAARLEAQRIQRARSRVRDGPRVPGGSTCRPARLGTPERGSPGSFPARNSGGGPLDIRPPESTRSGRHPGPESSA